MHTHTMSMTIEGTNNEEMVDERCARSEIAMTPDRALDKRFDMDDESCPECDDANEEKEMEQMKDRFAKLLLGEDMSGGGKGVASALALSNAITNLAASVFAEQKKLQAMPPEQKSRWMKEIEWLLSVADFIVEFAPAQQVGKDGTCMEIMTTRQRSDLQMNIRALKKLDYVLMNCLDSFKDQTEFYYVSKDPNDQTKTDVKGGNNKWWLPTVKVSANGLSDAMLQWIQFQKDSINQVLKAAMAINAQVLSKMEIPENYIESLPKNGRSSLGDSIYKSITDQSFDPEQFLSSMDFSSEHKIVDLKNRIEASIVIWKRKMNNKDSKSPWGSSVSLEKREIFEERAESVLLILKHRFPGISQSALDTSKIQYNKDVGHALIESYSRVLESLAHKILSQMEEVLYSDSLIQNPTLKTHKKDPQIPISMKLPKTRAEIEMSLNAIDATCSMTLSDFMGVTQNEGGDMTDGDLEELAKDVNQNSLLAKLKNEPSRKLSYIEKLENSGGSRSPRHV